MKGYIVERKCYARRPPPEKGSHTCKDNQLRDTSVEGFGRLIGTLLQLTVMLCLLDEIQKLLGSLRVRDGICCGSHCQSPMTGVTL